MKVTILQTFVYAPAGREERRYSLGDVVDMAKADFEKITESNKNLLFDGVKKIDGGICHSCTKVRNRANNRNQNK